MYVSNRTGGKEKWCPIRGGVEQVRVREPSLVSSNSLNGVILTDVCVPGILQAPDHMEGRLMSLVC